MLFLCENRFDPIVERGLVAGDLFFSGSSFHKRPQIIHNMSQRTFKEPRNILELCSYVLNKIVSISSPNVCFLPTPPGICQCTSHCPNCRLVGMNRIDSLDNLRQNHNDLFYSCSLFGSSQYLNGFFS